MSEAKEPAKATESAPAVTVEQFNSLQEKFDNLYAKHVDTTKKVEEWSKLGDPETLRGKLEDYDGLRKQKAGNNKEEIDLLIKEAREEEGNAWKNKVTELETTLKAKADLVRNYTISQPATEIASELFVKGAKSLIVQHIQQVADLDGESPVIKGADGKPLRSKVDPSRPMGVREYLENYAKENPDLALPKGASGAGANGEGASSTGEGPTVEAYLAMTPEQRRALPAKVQSRLAPLALKAIGKQR